MTYEAQKIGTVEGLGDIYRVAAPLDEQLRAFADKGIHTLAAPDEVAQIHLDDISTTCSRTSMAPIALRGGKTILVRDSILMAPLMASAAVKAHASERYFETNRDVYEAAEALARSQESMYPEDRSALIVSQERDLILLTPKMPESRFILRKQTEPYFDKFTEGKIKFYNLFGNSDSQTIINYMWFGPPLINSGLYCSWSDLDDDYPAFGVLRTTESSAKNTSASNYTPTDVQRFHQAVERLREVVNPKLLEDILVMQKNLHS